MAEAWMRVDAGGRWFADLRGAAEARAGWRVDYEPSGGADEGPAASTATAAPRELADLLFCQTCNRTLTRHPRDVVDEIDAYYCPHSLENMTSSEAMSFLHRSPRFFECPVCQAVLGTEVVHVNGSQDGAAEDNGPAVRFMLACGHCRWDSARIRLVASSPEELISLALQREKDSDTERTRLVPALTKHFAAVESELGLSAIPSPDKSQTSSGSLLRNARKPPASREHHDDEDAEASDPEADETLWRWEDADRAQKERAQEALLGGPGEEVPEDLSALLASLLAKDEGGAEDQPPQRSRLRIKRSIRCRQCMDANLDNILVKGQINPLKGDSSIRTNVGQWFKKKSLAYDHLPRIVVIENDGNAKDDELTVVVTNPRDVPLQLRFDQGPSVRLDAFDEVEEMDLITAAQPPRPSKPRDDDPKDVVLARFFNKALVRIPASPRVKSVHVQETDGDAADVSFRIHLSPLER